MTPNDKDVRGKICKIVSRMLDNPDDCGIYPTTQCYDELEALVNSYRQPSLVPLTEQEEERLCDFYLALGEVKYKDDDLLKEFETFVKPLFSKFGHRPVSTWDAPMVLTPILDFEETNAKETGSTEVEPTVGKKSVSREVIRKIIATSDLTQSAWKYFLGKEKDALNNQIEELADAILKAMEGKE